MKPTTKLDETKTPDGNTLALYEHDGDYTLRVGTAELMSSRRHRSEDRLAEIACAPLATAPNPTVLIGGLGLGFTLKAALSALPSDARVVVAELLAKVVDWNRNTDYPLAHDAVADPRVDIRVADVADVLRDSPQAFDAIMLDVDNGTDAVTMKANDRLYADEGIHIAANALRDKGRLVYWSADADPKFVRALRRNGLEVEVIEERIYPSSRRMHYLFVVTRRGVAGVRAPRPARSAEA